MSRSLSLALAFVFADATFADDKDTSPDRLKAGAVEALTKAEVKDPRTVETDHLIVAGGLPEVKLKAIADSVEKVHAKAHKALQFDATPQPKTVVYLFPDVDALRQYKRSVLKERAADDEYCFYDVKGDVTKVVVSPRRGDRNPKFEQLAGDEVCRALLARKAGPAAKLTEWMKDGFAKAVTWRLDPKTASTERGTARRLAPPVGKNWKGMCVVEMAWSGSGKDKDAIAATLMDFFTFGAGADKLPSVLGALLPSDAVAEPKFDGAIAATGWKVEELEYAWRDWLRKGSPEFKAESKK